MIFEIYFFGSMILCGIMASYCEAATKTHDFGFVIFITVIAPVIFPFIAIFIIGDWMWHKISDSKDAGT